MTDNPDNEYTWNQAMQIPLTKKLKANLKSALLSRDTDRKNTIRLIMAEYPKLTVPITLENGKKRPG